MLENSLLAENDNREAKQKKKSNAIQVKYIL